VRRDKVGMGKEGELKGRIGEKGRGESETPMIY